MIMYIKYYQMIILIIEYDNLQIAHKIIVADNPIEAEVMIQTYCSVRLLTCRSRVPEFRGYITKRT